LLDKGDLDVSSRTRSVWFAALLAVLPGCGVALTPAPLPEPKSEDYAQARKSFKTKLAVHRPAPQSWGKPRRPPGAVSITYRSGDLQLRAYVTPDPGDGKRRPAVLFLHGGFAFGAEDWEMPRPFREAGYVIMVPVLRGENGQPGDYTTFYDEVDDVLGAADTLAALPYVDPSRIFVAGHSAGGTLALLAAMATNRFRAAAAFSGSPDQKDFLDSQPEFGSYDTSNPREFEVRSPLVYATSFKCPVRMYYGNLEGWAARASHRTAELAKAKGIDAEAVEVPGDHFSSVPSGLRESLVFFRGKLTDVAVSGPKAQ
jgi:dienelactone hydrolase